MTRLIRAELFKLRTTKAWWLYGLASLLATVVMLVVDLVQAHSLLKPFDAFVALQTHGNGAHLPPEFLARLRDEWTLGHDAATQAATVFTAGQLPGVLLACLLGIVLVTSEFAHQTATTTFLLSPRRTEVVTAKLMTGILLAAVAWLASTLLSVVAGAVFLHAEGYGSQLGYPGVVRAVLLNLAAYLLWAVFGVGVGALVRHQLAATVGVTVLYLVGAGAASSVFELLNTYVLQQDWVLAAQVVVPTVASAVMISPTATFDQSPPQWVGAVVLLAYGAVLGALGVRTLRHRDIA